MALHVRHHRLIRFCALAVTVGALGYAATRARSRADITSEGLSKLTPATEELIRSIAVERPVVVHAFVSREVPREYVEIRLRLLNLLREQRRSVGELAEATGYSAANVSRHLALLAQHGVLARETQGTSVYYSIADPAIYRLCDLVCDNLARRFERTAPQRAAFAPARKTRPQRSR